MSEELNNEKSFFLSLYNKNKNRLLEILLIDKIVFYGGALLIVLLSGSWLVNFLDYPNKRLSEYSMPSISPDLELGSTNTVFGENGNVCIIEGIYKAKNPGELAWMITDIKVEFFYIPSITEETLGLENIFSGWAQCEEHGCLPIFEYSCLDCFADRTFDNYLDELVPFPVLNIDTDILVSGETHMSRAYKVSFRIPDDYVQMNSRGLYFITKVSAKGGRAKPIRRLWFFPPRENGAQYKVDPYFRFQDGEASYTRGRYECLPAYSQAKKNEHIISPENIKTGNNENIIAAE